MDILLRVFVGKDKEMGGGGRLGGEMIWMASKYGT